MPYELRLEVINTENDEVETFDYFYYDDETPVHPIADFTAAFAFIHSLPNVLAKEKE